MTPEITTLSISDSLWLADGFIYSLFGALFLLWILFAVKSHAIDHIEIESSDVGDDQNPALAARAGKV